MRFLPCFLCVFIVLFAKKISEGKTKPSVCHRNPFERYYSKDKIGNKSSKLKEESVVKKTENSKKKMAAAVRPFVLKSAEKCSASVIFLHGLGDTGYGWSLAFDEMNKAKHIRYVFPNAPVVSVSINMGAQMPAWFDIESLDMSAKEDKQGIQKASEELRKLIKQEQDEFQIPSSRIILGGFSMGGALALYTAITHKEPLGGVIGLSSWLPLRNEFTADNALSHFKSPVFQGHGNADPMVQEAFGSMTHSLLKSKSGSSQNVEYKTYQGMGHSSCDEEMKDVQNFINKVLPPNCSL